MSYFENESLLNRSCDGNTIILKGKEYDSYCKHCDCENTHVCIICDSEITSEGCKERDGHCFYCFIDKNS